MPIFVGAGTSSFMKGGGGVGVSQITTTQRDALSNVEQGQIIFNTTTGKVETYNGSTWESLQTAFNASGGNEANGDISGGYKYHTFTNSGTLTVNTGTVDAEILVVGGGGGGGSNNNAGSDGGGGGGAGGVVLAPSVPLSPGTYNITVGSGGAGGQRRTTENNSPNCRTKNPTYAGDSGDNGGNSIFGASSPDVIKITALGGGGGGSGPNAGNQDCGGSGGGAGGGGSPGTNGAAGNQPSQNPSHAGPLSQYGNGGGPAPSSPIFLGGGGGGAQNAGQRGGSGGNARGGDAVQLPAAWDASAIGFAHGQGRYYGGGGTGGNQNNVTTNPAGASTGGGGTGHSTNTGPNPGAANGSGGGGGAGVPCPGPRENGGDGGKGLVVIRYVS